MPLRPWPVVIFASVLMAFANPAAALGFAEPSHNATLGRALDLSIPLLLEEGQTLPRECVSAVVSLGERRLGSGALSLSIESHGNPRRTVLRVRSSTVVDEPVIGLNVVAGCEARVARQFTVFADPPALASVPLVARAAVPGVEDRRAAGTAARRSRSGEADSALRTGVEPPRQRPRAVQADALPAVPRLAAGSVREPAADTSLRLSAMPRLRLDMMDSLPVAEAPASSRSGLSGDIALLAAQVSASAAQERAQLLDRDLNQLRSQAQNNQREIAALRQELQQARGGQQLFPFLLALLGLVGLLTVWLAWRLRSLQRSRHNAWWSPEPDTLGDLQGDSQLSAASLALADDSEAGPGTLPPPTAAPAPAPEKMARTVALVPVPPPPAPSPPLPSAPASPSAPARGDAPPPLRPGAALAARSLAALRGKAGAPAMPAVQAPHLVARQPHRPMSVDELIDLEQQAEFFIVLGQDEAAIDLLVAHLRSSGGTSPLPYLKLMEIHKRRHERKDYERIRGRFNDRFNAYAPEWEADLQHGRSLEDYAAVMARLQSVWPRPLDAMAELEALLFRKHAGELFELPAYRELLVLYAMARDLLDRGELRPEQVDLLLPLGSEHSTFGMTAPQPFMGLHDSGSAPLSGRPPGARRLELDLDLGAAEAEAQAEPPAITAHDSLPGRR